ncbi:anaphase-promoting complex subunit CDC26-like isoform X2 [Bacillus rossius redtenbacheri]
MIRRSPTRIGLKLEDMPEYERYRRELDEVMKAREARRPEEAPGDPWSPLVVPAGRAKPEAVHERIGYVPQPRTVT